MRKLKPKVEGMLLDLDGTIVDSKEAYMEATKIALKTSGKG
jgi:beta-phosphoglucomutase-like phosphatase (HAD superfamily)